MSRNVTLTTNACSDRTRRDSFKTKEGRFRLGINKKVFTVRIMGQWYRWPRKLADPHSWKQPRPGWMGFWATWSSERYLFPWQGCWNQIILKSILARIILWFYDFGFSNLVLYQYFYLQNINYLARSLSLICFYLFLKAGTISTPKKV